MLVIKRAGKHFFEKKRFLAPLPVDYIIRNKYSYPGGSYGEYGGYDLVLIRLKDPGKQQRSRTGAHLFARE